MLLDLLNYLLKEKAYMSTGNNISYLDDGRVVVFFPNVYKAYAPDGVAPTEVGDYVFHLNGIYIEHDTIEMNQDSDGLRVYIDTHLWGYTIVQTDELHVWGLFE